MPSKNSEVCRIIENEIRREDAKSLVICVFGKRGYGKSTLSKQIIQLYSKVFIYDSLNEYYDVAVAVSMRRLPKHHHHFRYAFHTTQEGEFDKVCEMIYEAGDMLFVVEECDWFCSANYTSENFKKIIRYGRHRNISILAISRRPADLSRLLTSQANYIISYRQTEPRDIEALEKYGFNGTELCLLGVGQCLCLSL